MLELTVRLVASLAVVLGLLMLMARYAGRRFRSAHGAVVQVVHRQPLSRTSQLVVVTIGPRVLVLGTTEQQVTLVSEMDPEELAELTEAPELANPDAGASPALVPAGQGAPHGPLAGSLLSADTWRQAFAAATGRARSGPAS